MHRRAHQRGKSCAVLDVHIHFRCQQDVDGGGVSVGGCFDECCVAGHNALHLQARNIEAFGVHNYRRSITASATQQRMW